jgi:hypothetical protein
MSLFGDGASRKIALAQSRARERNQRLLHAKDRTIWVDRNALDEQRRAKARRKREAREADLAAARDERALLAHMRDEHISHSIRERDERDRLAMEWKSAHMLKPKLNKEWDLNDPNRLKNDSPARVGDDDPRCGPASMQQFAGEDLGLKNRVKRDKLKMRSLLERQVAEKRAREAREREAEKTFAREQAAAVSYVEEHEYGLASDAAQKRYDYQAQNKALAAQRRRARRARKAEDDALGQLEMQYQMNNRMLAGDPEQARSRLGEHRVRRDHFKGMNKRQLQAIWDEQNQQRERRAARAASARRREDTHAAEQRRIVDALGELEMEDQIRRQRARMQHATELSMQAREDRVRARAELAARKAKTASGFTAGANW